MTVAAPVVEAEVVAPALGTPEYDAAMIEKADKVFEAPAVEETPAEPKAERPEWLDPKFESPEDMAKAYAELQAKLSGKEEPKPVDTEGMDEAEIAASEVASKAGLDYAALSEEYAANGKLTDESYQTLLDKAGLSRETVDGYIEGRQAVAREAEYRAYAIAGGEDQYAEMVSWAGANLTPAEIAAFNKGVTNSTAEETALAVAGLKSKFVAARGQEPALLNGGAGAELAAQGYTSHAEMTAAMRDPRYAKDPAYRKSVEQKVAVSNIF
jgi:hypothetical protein